MTARSRVSLALLVLLTVFLAVAGARASVKVPTSALQHGLAALPAEQKSVLAQVGFQQAEPQGGAVPPAVVTGYRQQVRDQLERSGLPLAAARTDWSGLTTGFAQVTAGGRAAYDGDTPPQLQFDYRDSLAAHARLVAGRLPGATRPGRHGPVFEVAVTQATARRFGLVPGSHLTVNPGLAIVVTGIFQPAGPRSAFWGSDPVGPAPTLNLASTQAPAYWQGAAFVGPAEVTELETATDAGGIDLDFGYPLALGGLTAAQDGQLAAQLSDLTNLGQVGVDPPVIVPLSAGVGGFLAAFRQEQAAVTAVWDIMLVSLAAIGIVVILLAAGLLASQRRAEFELLRARGAARRQLAALAARTAAVVTIPAAVVGAAAAVALTPGAQSPLAWWLAGLILAAPLLGLPLLLAAGPRSPARPGHRPASARIQRRRAQARRIVAELTLTAGAVAGLTVAHGLGAGGPDVLTSAAPVLVAIPAAIVALRCYPLLARGLAQAAARGRGVVAYVGLARAARTTLTAVLPAFALVLVLAVISFGALVRATVARGEVAASWQQTGADATVDTLNASLPLSPAAVRALAAVPGVTRTAQVTMTTGTESDGTQIAVALVSPASYAALIATTPGPAFPARALLGRAGQGRVPVVATPAAARAIGRADTVLTIGTAGRLVGIRLTATAPAAPVIAARADGPVLIMPRSAVPADVIPPNLLLLAGPSLDGTRLTAVASRVVPGASVGLRAAVLHALARAPLPHDTDLAYAAGIAAAAAAGVLVLLIALLLGAGSRTAALTRLGAMGLSAGQGSWLVLAETTPLLAVAIAGGAACAWALAAVVGPDLSLSVFTGSGASVRIQPEPAALLLAAAGLLAVALATLVAQAVVAGRRSVAAQLRIGDGR